MCMDIVVFFPEIVAAGLRLLWTREYDGEDGIGGFMMVVGERGGDGLE